MLDTTCSSHESSVLEIRIQKNVLSGTDHVKLYMVQGAEKKSHNAPLAR